MADDFEKFGPINFQRICSVEGLNYEPNHTEDEVVADQFCTATGTDWTKMLY